MKPKQSDCIHKWQYFYNDKGYCIGGKYYECGYKRVESNKKELPVLKQLEDHIKKHPKHKHYILYCYCCNEYIT